MILRPPLRVLVTWLGVVAIASPVAAQTVSQDYARYSSMLNQERADTAKREQQSMYDQATRDSQYSGNGGSSRGSASSGGGSSTNAEIVGLLGNSLNNFVARRNERALERQRAEAAYVEKMRLVHESEARMTAKIMGTDRPLIQQNLEKAAKGDAKAMAEAGLQYLDGIGVTKNHDRGVQMLIDAAQHGDVPTMAHLAFWYRHPEAGVVPLDLEQSNAWLFKAAEGGDLVSQQTLGVYLIRESGSGMPDQPLEALRWSRIAADRGSLSAMENTGTYLSGFDGIPTDRATAEVYYRKAIAGGSPTATDHLIRMLENDERTDADLAKAFALRLSLAEKGDPVQEAMVGVYYKHGYGGTVDTPKALEWFNRAVAHGSSRALYEMAIIYDDGLGVPQDQIKARSLFRQAAVQGFPRALYVMGYCYFEGIRILQDEIEGERLLRLAAEKGDESAPRVLAQIYRDGLGEEPDKAEEIKWLRLGAERGDQRCIDQLQAAGVPLVDPAAVKSDPGVATLASGKTSAAPAVQGTMAKSEARISVEAKTATFIPVQPGAAESAAPPEVRLESGAARTLEIGTVSSYDNALKDAHDRIALVAKKEHSRADFARNMILALFDQAKAARPDLTERAFVLELHDRGLAGDVTAAYHYAAARLAKIGFNRIASKEAEGNIAPAMRAGLAEAQRDYGVLLIHGIGVQEDPAAGYALVKKAADAGLASAIVLQGELLLFGVGVEKDAEGGVALWKKGAEAGDPIGQYYYGLSQKKDHPDVALRYFKLAAEAGDDRAIYSYGWALNQGYGAPADPETGIKWIEKAALAGHPQAEYVMGVKYAEGDGVPEDPAFACFYWEAGAKNGWPGAQLNLGLRKLNGDGTTPNREEGIAWLKKAAAQGNDDAAEMLTTLGAD